MMVDSMEVEIFLENGIVPFVIYVNDQKAIVHDCTFSINFKFQISFILLEKVVLNFMGKVTQAILQKPIENASRRR
jgi:hypothetical protein